MRSYAFDDQYNITTNNHSSSSTHPDSFAAIDYFQFDFNEFQYHNCWKFIQHSAASSPFIPQSTNITRLENIIWRKWAKSKSNLKECRPETVNWYKDCDITWLYGPLADTQRGEQYFGHCAPSTSTSTSSPGATSCTTATPLAIPQQGERHNSLSSLSSASSASSVDSTDTMYDQDTDDEIHDAVVFTDDDYSELFSVKSILKQRKSKGPLDLEEFRSKQHKRLGVPIKKSVSFAEMVQIRQFY